MDYEEQLKNARSIGDLFELVKALVRDFLGVEQAGLMIGISDLGISPEGFIGAYYSPDANIIILNKRPLATMMRAKPAFYPHYLFHLLLHEYVHSIGAYDELQTRQLVLEITTSCFGENHPITELTWNIGKHLPTLEHIPPSDLTIEFVSGIDRKNTDYIN